MGVWAYDGPAANEAPLSISSVSPSGKFKSPIFPIRKLTSPVCPKGGLTA
jgi:hypothetical protein